MLRLIVLQVASLKNKNNFVSPFSGLKEVAYYIPYRLCVYIYGSKLFFSYVLFEALYYICSFPCDIPFFAFLLTHLEFLTLHFGEGLCCTDKNMTFWVQANLEPNISSNAYWFFLRASLYILIIPVKSK